MKKTAKKVLAAFLALAITASSMPFALASDTLPYLGESARGENQPYQHGYRAEDFLDWSPETDPYSEYLRARIPLQDRNAALAATQANPELSPETQWFTLAGDYGNAFFDSYPYTNEFSQYLFNFWQYTDYYGSWHGMPTEEVPEEMYQDERGVNDAWQYRKFEFGLINMPNPGYTNAAHKNGVLSIGCIFLPRTGLKHTVLLTQDEDGNFPYAEKLIELCEYYGFDGWFINQEETIPAGDVDLYKGFMKQMRDAGLYIQWYDSVVDPSGRVSYQNEFNSSNSPFVVEDGVQYSDSIFLNYWWNHSMLSSSADHAVSLGVDPLDVVFAGIEAGGDRWSQGYDLRDNIGEDGQPMNSIASLGSEFVHDGLDEDLDNGTNDNVAMRREKDEFQWMTFERERRWWSGPFQDPSEASYTADRSTYPQDETIGVGTRENQNFDGVAAYITERSVINGDTFVTSFNTGHGLEYRIGGEVSNSDEWSNIIIQDILPTWQWWFETDGTKLNADFDYGPEYKKNYDNGKEDVLGNEGSFDFDLVGAYQGGSSLVVYGAVDAENFLHLYKTDLDVAEDTQVALTFKKSSEDDVAMKLGLIFEDDTDTVVKLDVADSAAKSDEWVTSTVDLSAYAGRKVAAMGLVFDGTAEDYQMNIGKLAYTTGAAEKPATPTGFTIDKAYDTDEMYVSWDMADYDEVKQYNLYAMKDGKEIYLGGTYDEVFYIKDLEDAIADSTGTVISDVTVTPSNLKAEAGSTVSFDAVVSGATQTAGEVTLVLKAVSEDGTESDGAVVTHNYNEGVSNIEVTAEDGKLNVTWEGGQADVAVTKEYSTDDRTWTASGNNGCTVEVPTGADADYARYTMTITTPSGVVTTYDGRMDDSYCKPYTGKVAANGTLEVPLAKDWYQMVYKTVTNGEESAESTITRYSDNMPSIRSSVDSVMIKLIDYRGNESEWVTIPNLISVSVAADGESVEAGQSIQMKATVKNYAETDAVTWSVSGAKDPTTAIDENGVLYIGEEECASSVSVTATSVENTTVSGSTNVAVVAITKIRPEGGELYCGESQQYIVEKSGKPMPINNYTWDIVGADSLKEGTSITENGYLTIGMSETAASVTIRATKKDTDLIYTTKINILPVYELSAESTSAYPGDTVAVSVEKMGEVVPAEQYTWTVEGAENEGTVVENGVLTIAEGETSKAVEVKAMDADGNSFSTTISINDLYALTPSYASMSPGGQQQFAVHNQKLDADVDATLFDWSVESAYPDWYGEISSADTKIDENGLLVLGEDEECMAINVICTNKETGASYSVTVYNFSWYSIQSEDEALTMAEMPQANAAPKADEISQEVTWTVEGATSKNTTIDQDGNLTIADGEKAAVLVVRATSVADPSKSGVSYVTVTPSKSILRTTYEYALTLSTEGVVDSAVKYFEDAKTAAKAVLDNPDATAEEIDTAWDNLLDGIWGLGLTKGDKTVLEQLIAKADEMVENVNMYVETNWSQLEEALAAAKEVYNDGDAMDDDIEPAAEALLNAIMAQRYKADKSILNDLVNKANEMDVSGYTAESVAVFKAALYNANLVLADESLSEDDQAVVDEAVAELNEAIENLSADTSEPSTDDGKDDGSSTEDNSSNTDDTSKPDSTTSDTDTSKGDSTTSTTSKDDSAAETAPTTGDNSVLPLFAVAAVVTAGLGLVVLKKKENA